MINYYEVLFENEYGVCIKGLRKPSIEEANEFCKAEVKGNGKVISVDDIDYEESCRFYDMENEVNFPVFN